MPKKGKSMKKNKKYPISNEENIDDKIKISSKKKKKEII